MNYFEKILQISNQNLSKMDINQLEKELNTYYCLYLFIVVQHKR